MLTERQILDEVIASLDKARGIPTENYSRYLLWYYPQRLTYLSQELRQHILRDEGDIKKYLRLQKAVFDLVPDYHHTQDEAMYAVIKWLDEVTDNIFPVTADKNTVVINMLVFGESYIRKMLDYNFKSMMAPGNLPILCKEKKVILLLQTDEKSKKLIEAAPITGRLKALGVLFDWNIIPDELMAALKSPDINYLMLGASGAIGLFYAKSHFAAFHQSFPDIIYSEKFFSELLRLSKTHQAILGAGMRSDEFCMLKAIRHHITPETLSIPSSDLMAHHLNNLHFCSWPFLVNNRPAYWLFPEFHIQVWESENTVHFNSPHLMAHWLDYEVLKNLPRRYYQTLDSELDHVCKDDNYYVIQDCDEAYQVELSPPERQGMSDVYSDMVTVAHNIWAAVGIRDNSKFFFKEMRVKLNRDIRPLPANYIPAKHVETMQRQLYNTLMWTDKYAASPLGKNRTHVGWIFE